MSSPWDNAPPANETEAQKTAREKRELDALATSEAIDEEIKRQRANLKKEKGVIRVLLLGQAHSGKSTTLKNFRLKYAPADWERERRSWKAVVQLNLIRNVLSILFAVQAEMNSELVSEYPSSSSSPIIRFTDKHQLLVMRLAPLRQTEADLQRRLGAGAEEFRLKSPSQHSPLDAESPFGHSDAHTEWAVRSWQDALESVAPKNQQPLFDSASEAISNLQQDIKALWEDETVKLVVAKYRVFSQDSSGFFMPDVDRIATRSYEPIDDDILKARLRTVGVQEHRLGFTRSSDTASTRSSKGPVHAEWMLYDVGGCRTQRSAWIPYFENIHAIIFLAPVSCFDERLEEDPRINRLQDSLFLWDTVCASPLLLKTTFILFLNKCDLLRKKMKTGVRVKDYLTSYGDRPNDAKTFVKYLQIKFRDKLYHTQEPINRNFYSFLTSVVDAKATSATLTSVQDGIFREHLSESNFL
ncbi:heterotrimeric G protein alpha subunit [Pterulicium gracile]|uniref:Heterotrimeric G protein alpha subunit n=1 Tax=Pterulicium gracile TaxID=1884261 RepID=A0A5C3QM63_9AGAR|nr:heterotrimeric G protein alpha subunit [Pterula gracilis]